MTPWHVSKRLSAVLRPPKVWRRIKRQSECLELSLFVSILQTVSKRAAIFLGHVMWGSAHPRLRSRTRLSVISGTNLAMMPDRLHTCNIYLSSALPSSSAMSGVDSLASARAAATIRSQRAPVASGASKRSRSRFLRIGGTKPVRISSAPKRRKPFSVRRTCMWNNAYSLPFTSR